jgi:hypothetical protein
MNEKKMMIAYDRKRTSTLTLDSQPGAHTGATRQYIPGYASSNIVYLDLVSGDNAWTGENETDSPAGTGPKLTYAAAVTAAGSTKKIRIVSDSAALTSSVSVPTEMKIGLSGTITGSQTTPVDTFSESASTTASRVPYGVAYSPSLNILVAVGNTTGSASYFAYSTNGTTWTDSVSTTASRVFRSVAWSPELEIFSAVGNRNFAYSTDGITWTDAPLQLPSGYNNESVAWSPELEMFVAVGASGSPIQSLFCYSYDGIEWTESGVVYADAGFEGVAWSPTLLKFAAVGKGASNDSRYAYSSDGINWTMSATTAANNAPREVAWSPTLSLFVAVGNASAASFYAYSSDALTWSASASTTASRIFYGVAWSPALGVFAACGVTGGGASAYSYSTNGTTWTESASTVASRTFDGSMEWFPKKGTFIAIGHTSANASAFSYSAQYSITISAAVAGFTISRTGFSGTEKLYNCTIGYIGTTAALSLDACRVNADCFIENNAVTSFASLYIADRHLTCTPASQDAIDMNLDTVGGTWYIYNASETAYERIRDCLVEGGIVANYPVNVTGRANVQGLSTNVNFGADVTHNDPKFVNTTDYQLQFQTNGYARNSLAVGRSNLYFNSAGDPRDIGAWSYVESAVSYFYSKSAEIYKGFISHELEEVVSEQQGDSGEISVYGNVNRLKEAVTLNYPSSRTAERAVFEYMRFVADKKVKISIDPEWDGNAITVVVNGNQSAGVEFLTVDATAIFDGEWLTIAGKKYFIYRASPNKTAATKLILDRPLEDAVTDNDVISANYPTGAGEYDYAAIGKLNLSRKDMSAFEVEGWRSGFSVRFVRKASQ